METILRMLPKISTHDTEEKHSGNNKVSQRFSVETELNIKF